MLGKKGSVMLDGGSFFVGAGGSFFVGAGVTFIVMFFLFVFVLPAVFKDVYVFEGMRLGVLGLVSLGLIVSVFCLRMLILLNLNS